MKVVDDDLWADLQSGEISLDFKLFLEPHKTLRRMWKVEAESDDYLIDLADYMSSYDTVSIWSYDAFEEAASRFNYEIYFLEDPTPVFEWRDSLSTDPEVYVESRLDGRIDRNGNPLRLVNGFLPFQAQGINFMKTMDRAVYYQWSTGTGKTLAAEGTILWKREHGYGKTGQQGFDLCLYVVKPNNLINSQRKLTEHTGLESTLLIGTPAKRDQILLETIDQMEVGAQPILIFNAEKFSDDKPGLMALITDQNVLVIFDEMPTKYANRQNALYKNTCEVLYKSFVSVWVGNGKKRRKENVFYPKAGSERAAQMFSVSMSATPIRNTPEDTFNQIRIVDPTLFGSVNDFNTRYVAGRDRWGRVTHWKHLEYMGLVVAGITHAADKERDPDIKAQFPEKLPPEVIFSVMDKNSQWLYRQFESQYDFEAILSGRSLIDWDEILSAIQVLQMICSNPRSVLMSAQKWDEFTAEKGHYQQKLNLMPIPAADKKALMKDFEKKNKQGSEVAWKFVAMVNDDSRFTDGWEDGECVLGKMLDLKYLIENHDDKVVVFTAMNELLLPLIAGWFDLWGISYVAYHGGLTSKQKQVAQDAFREDPDIQVFLSTDAGQDSIDLPEASLTIHYDWPWTWSGVKQRENRQDRIDSEKDVVRTVTLTHPGTVEDRKAEIVVIKKGYHYQVYGGEVAEQSDALAGQAGYLYILTGGDPT